MLPVIYSKALRCCHREKHNALGTVTDHCTTAYFTDVRDLSRTMGGRHYSVHELSLVLQPIPIEANGNEFP